jgi:type III pantothenate kinase
LNICIDIGNTNSKLGVFDQNELISVRQNISDRQLIKVIKKERPENVFIGSVRKGIGKIVGESSKNSNTLMFDWATPVPIKNKYGTPNTLGVDRIAAAVGASFLYPEKNCLTIDIGTCITYDTIDRTGTYLGGGISPGVEMKLKALHKFTSGLPSVAFINQTALIGTTTKECMQSGVLHGTIAELEGIISRYGQFYENLTIIFCGGGAIFFESKIKGHIFAIPNLVLIGLNQILRHNLHD